MPKRSAPPAGKMLGEMMKDHRRALGMSQYDVADVFGVEQSSVSRWERHVVAITDDYLAAVAQWLGITVEDAYLAQLDPRVVADVGDQLDALIIDVHEMVEQLRMILTGLTTLVAVTADA